MPWPLIAAAGGSLVGGLLANRGRAAEARGNRAFQRTEARTQMAFQERMRNTEWQSAVADMEAAGINPALAYQQGGASSPSGAAGSGSKAEQSDVISPAVSSALQYKRLKAEVDGINATRLRTEAETTRLKAAPSVVGASLVEKGTGAIETMVERMPQALRTIQYEMSRILARFGAPQGQALRLPVKRITINRRGPG